MLDKLVYCSALFSVGIQCLYLHNIARRKKWKTQFYDAAVLTLSLTPGEEKKIGFCCALHGKRSRCSVIRR